MSEVSEAFAPLHQPGRLRWLGSELAPFPGRPAMMLRMAVTVALVTVISMALQTPETALSAYMVFFVTKENRVLTLVTGVLMILGVTLAVAGTLVLFLYTFDYPALRIPVMAATVFGGMYLSRVFVIGPLGFAIGFVVAVTQSAAENVPAADLLARLILWLWLVVVYPIAITVVINQILFPADPWAALARGLAERLEAAAAVVRRVIRERRAGGEKNATLLEMATRGSRALHADVKFAAIQDVEFKRKEHALSAAVEASERVAQAAAMLELRTAQSLTDNDMIDATALLAALDELAVALREGRAMPGQMNGLSPGTMPELRALALAADELRGHLVAQTPSEARTPKKKKQLFVSDALTNPAHVRFALKVTLAAMACYLIYSGLNWPGIHTAFITCCFIALENTGATLRKARLRLAGCAIGGLFGFLAILYLVPHMESIGSLILLVVAGSLVAGWVAAGSERIAYAGLQIAFAFYLCIFQGFAPGTDFETIRDRLVGIVLGIVVSTVVFHKIWPEDAAETLRKSLADVLRNLAKLIRIPLPTSGDTVALEAKVSHGLDETLRLAELAQFETLDRQAEGVSTIALARSAEHAQVLYLIAATLAAPARMAEWNGCEEQTQIAEAIFRGRVARRLESAADSISTGRPTPGVLTKLPGSDEETSLMKKDRLRLLRSLEENVERIG